MAIAKVILNGVTQMDTTQKTVTAGSMLSGTTALKNDGTDITGSIATRTSSNMSVSGGTITAQAGYYASDTSKSVSNMTLPSSLSNSSSGTNKTAIKSDTSTKYLNIPTGYNGTAQYYTVSPMILDSDTFTSNGTYYASDYDADGFSQVTVNVSGGSSKNAQVAQSNSRSSTTSMTAISNLSITVAETGKYDVYWSAFRTSTSGTWQTQLYIENSAYGSAQTQWSNHIQNVYLTNVSLTKNQTIQVYGIARGTNYYLYGGTLTIIQSS